MMDEKTMYEQCMSGENVEFEEGIAGIIAVHPWIAGDDLLLLRLRRAMASHFGGDEDWRVDLVQMADDVAALIHRSECVGDAQALRGFYELYAEVCTMYRYRSEEGLPDDAAR